MTYIDGFMAAVPRDKKADYIAYSKKFEAIFKEYGATAYVEGWGDDVPEGKLTSMPMAVKCKETETVIFSWVLWKDKAARTDAWAKMEEDSRFTETEMPCDGKRMIFGGFDMIVGA